MFICRIEVVCRRLCWRYKQICEEHCSENRKLPLIGVLGNGWGTEGSVVNGRRVVGKGVPRVVAFESGLVRPHPAHSTGAGFCVFMFCFAASNSHTRISPKSGMSIKCARPGFSELYLKVYQTRVLNVHIRHYQRTICLHEVLELYTFARIPTRVNSTQFSARAVWFQ